jgi:2,4-dienoyl-CoA reductase-like NADH-dependent reductase (Old Yellow Enzyme family)
MTEGLADDQGRPGERLVRLYERWARGGPGLQITGNVMIDGRYLERVGNVIVEGDGPGDALAAWAAACREGSPAIAQLSHPGRQVNRFLCGEPVGPSAGPAVHQLASFSRPRALSAAEIEDVVSRFASSLPDGLEWSIARVTREPAPAADGGTSLAGVAGALLTLGLALVLGLVFSRRRRGGISG